MGSTWQLLLLPPTIRWKSTQVWESLFISTVDPFTIGKRGSQVVRATDTPGPSRRSRTFYVRDHTTGIRFPVDTGAEVSIIPVKLVRTPTSIQRQAINHSTSPTFGEKSLTLNLGFRRTFQWIFVVANLQTPILGADLLHHFGPLVDVKRGRLIDNTIGLTVRDIATRSPLISTVVFQPTTNRNADILKQNSDITLKRSLHAQGMPQAYHMNQSKWQLHQNGLFNKLLWICSMLDHSLISFVQTGSLDGSFCTISSQDKQLPPGWYLSAEKYSKYTARLRSLAQTVGHPFQLTHSKLSKILGC